MKPFKAVRAGWTNTDYTRDGPSRYDCYKVTGPIPLRAIQNEKMCGREARALASALNRAYVLGQKELM